MPCDVALCHQAIRIWCCPSDLGLWSICRINYAWIYSFYPCLRNIKIMKFTYDNHHRASLGACITLYLLCNDQNIVHLFHACLFSTAPWSFPWKVSKITFSANFKGQKILVLIETMRWHLFLKPIAGTLNWILCWRVFILSLRIHWKWKPWRTLARIG